MGVELLSDREESKHHFGIYRSMPCPQPLEDCPGVSIARQTNVGDVGVQPQHRSKTGSLNAISDYGPGVSYRYGLTVLYMSPKVAFAYSKNHDIQVEQKQTQSRSLAAGDENSRDMRVRLQ